MVWQPPSWEHLRRLPADLNPIDARDADKGPPAQIDVYTGGNLRWSDVIVPKGLEVVDQRLEAHGFTPADGIVLEGKVTDLATGRPSPRGCAWSGSSRRRRADIATTSAARAVADAQGRWVLKKAPAGWHRVVVEADGFVPRIVGYAQFDDQPRWASYDCGLSRPAPVSGRVTDDSGRPLADVEVRIEDVASERGGRYESPDGILPGRAPTAASSADRVPGRPGHDLDSQARLLPPGPGPADHDAGEGHRAVDGPVRAASASSSSSPEPAPAGYIVHIEPEGGEAVGKWSGSGNIDAANRIAFRDVPPGRYVLKGRPNPSRGNDTRPSR